MEEETDPNRDVLESRPWSAWVLPPPDLAQSLVQRRCRRVAHSREVVQWLLWCLVAEALELDRPDLWSCSLAFPWHGGLGILRGGRQELRPWGRHHVSSITFCQSKQVVGHSQIPGVRNRPPRSMAGTAKEHGRVFHPPARGRQFSSCPTPLVSGPTTGVRCSPASGGLVPESSLGGGRTHIRVIG